MRVISAKPGVPFSIVTVEVAPENSPRLGTRVVYQMSEWTVVGTFPVPDVRARGLSLSGKGCPPRGANLTLR